MEKHVAGAEKTRTGCTTGRECPAGGEATGLVPGGQEPEEILLYVGSHTEGSFYFSWNGTSLVIEGPAGCNRHQVPAGNPPGPGEFSRLHQDLDTLNIWSGHPAERACGCAGMAHYLFTVRWGDDAVDWRGSFDPVTDRDTAERLAQVRDALLRLRGTGREKAAFPGDTDRGEGRQDGR